MRIQRLLGCLLCLLFLKLLELPQFFVFCLLLHFLFMDRSHTVDLGRGLLRCLLLILIPGIAWTALGHELRLRDSRHARRCILAELRFALLIGAVHNDFVTIVQGGVGLLDCF